MSSSLGKVVHLSSVHKINDVRIFYKECRSLAAAGYDVTLIALGDADDVSDGVAIRAIRPNNRSRFFRMTATVWRVLRMALNERADVYHFHDPELLPIGLLLKLRGYRVIYDAHEDVPGQILTKHWIPRMFRRRISWMVAVVEQGCVHILDGVVTATPSIANSFPQSKTVVVQNYPLMEEMPTNIPPQSAEEKRRRVVYTGSLSSLRGANEMIDAMAILGPKGVRLTIAGIIRPDELERALRMKPGWRYVDFVGWQSRKAMGTILQSSDVGLVLFHPGPNHSESQPNKLFEYMAAGLPIVASKIKHWEQFVNDEHTGIMVNPSDPAQIADAVIELLTNRAKAREMGRNGQKAVREKFSWEHESGSLKALYGRVLRS